MLRFVLKYILCSEQTSEVVDPAFGVERTPFFVAVLPVTKLFQADEAK